VHANIAEVYCTFNIISIISRQYSKSDNAIMKGNRKLSEEAIVVPRHGSSSGKVQETLQKGGFDANLHIPPEGNFLIAYSMTPHYWSYELKGEGGIWMTSLAEKLHTIVVSRFRTFSVKRTKI